ncbi:MAG: hypothetical protein ABI402_08055 [Ferruginibacter sp.]
MANDKTNDLIQGTLKKNSSNLEHLEKTLLAAKEFKIIATSLVQSLSTLANIDFASAERNVIFRQVFKKQKEQVLNNDWNFCLHGAECRFTNSHSGEEIEVIIINGEECGALDPYFFYTFCKTSPKFKEVAEFYNENLKKIQTDLSSLYKQGYLKKVDATKIELTRNLTT